MFRLFLGSKPSGVGPVTVSVDALTLASSLPDIKPDTYALSTTIADYRFGGNYGYFCSQLGPLGTASAQYLVGVDHVVSRRFNVWKCTGDPTVLTNWDTLAGWSIDHLRQIYQMAAVLVGTKIHVVTGYENGYEYTYSVYDTATDTWEIKEEFIASGVGLYPSSYGACAIGVRSDGDVVVAYQKRRVVGGRDILLAIREGGTWTTDILIESTGPTQDRVWIIPGSSDRMHIVYSAFYPRHRTLKSDNSLAVASQVNAYGDISTYGGGSWSYEYSGSTYCGLGQTQTLDGVYATTWVSADEPTFSTSLFLSGGYATYGNGFAAVVPGSTTVWIQVVDQYSPHSIYRVFKKHGETPSPKMTVDATADHSAPRYPGCYVRSGTNRYGVIAEYFTGSVKAFYELSADPPVILDTLTLASSLPDIILPRTISVDTLTLASSAQGISVAVPVTVILDDLTLASSLEDVKVLFPIIVDALTLASSLEDIDAVPGTVSVLLDVLILASSLEDIFLARKVVLDDLTLASSIEDIDAVPGVATVVVDTLDLVASVQASRVLPRIILDVLILASSLEDIDAVPGPVSATMDVLTLAGSVLDITVKISPVADTLTLAATLVDVTVVRKAAAVECSFELSPVVMGEEISEWTVEPALSSPVMGTAISAWTVVPALSAPGCSFALAGETEVIPGPFVVELFRAVPLDSLVLAGSLADADVV
jgi:hypothetical protein